MSLKKGILTDVLRRVETFITHLDQTANRESFAPGSGPFVTFSRADLGWVALSNDEAKQYIEVLARLVKALPERPELTQRRLASMLQVAILRALDIPEARASVPFETRLQEALSELRAELARPPEPWEVFVPVHGIDPSSLPMSVGAARFQNMSDRQLNRLTERTRRRSDTGTSAKDHETSANTEFSRLIQEFMSSRRTVAAVRVDAHEQGAALIKAKEVLRPVLDCINFYSDIAHPHGTRALVFLAGEKEAALETPLFLRAGEQPTFTFSSRRAGPVEDFDLGRLKTRPVLRRGSRRVFELLSKSSHDELERRLLSAVQWAGRATAEDRPEQSFLLFVMALETLLLPSERQTELSYRLQLRCAHLLGRRRSTREVVKRDVRDLYNVRSRLVHQGILDVTTTELVRAKRYSKAAIVAVLTDRRFKKIKTAEDLEHWFELRAVS